MADILSHPEILSAEKLKDILSCRGIPSKDLVDKDKNGLVQLFHRFIVPLPQRTRNMRRANQLNKKSDAMRELCCRGIKRKSISPDKTVPTKDDSKQLTSSPTTECTRKIINLNMNCRVSKPLKLKRDCLLHDSKQNNPVTKSKILNCTRQSKVSETIQLECSKILNKHSSQSIQERDKQDTPKKFKRISVTWP